MNYSQSCFGRSKLKQAVEEHGLIDVKKKAEMNLHPGKIVKASSFFGVFFSPCVGWCNMFPISKKKIVSADWNWLNWRQLSQEKNGNYSRQHCLIEKQYPWKSINQSFGVVYLYIHGYIFIYYICISTDVICIDIFSSAWVSVMYYIIYEWIVT